MFAYVVEALEENDFEFTEVVSDLVKTYTPRCGSSLPAELSFNSMRDAERLTKAPSKVSNAQLQALHLKSIDRNMALDGPTAFKAQPTPACSRLVCNAVRESCGQVRVRLGKGTLWVTTFDDLRVLAAYVT